MNNNQSAVLVTRSLGRDPQPLLDAPAGTPLTPPGGQRDPLGRATGTRRRTGRPASAIAIRPPANDRPSPPIVPPRRQWPRARWLRGCRNLPHSQPSRSSGRLDAGISPREGAGKARLWRLPRKAPQGPGRVRSATSCPSRSQSRARRRPLRLVTAPRIRPVPARPDRQSFSKLWVAAISRHSALQARGPRRWKRRDLTIDDVRDVAEAFARLRDDGEGAAAALRRLSR